MSAAELLSTGADPGGPRPPIFGKVNFIFSLYTMSEKIELNFNFIVAEIRVFLEVWGVCVCVCVCVNP